jgi:hypothetical protein
MTSRTGPISTMRPAYMTATRSAVSAITPMSWVTSITAVLCSRQRPWGISVSRGIARRAADPDRRGCAFNPRCGHRGQRCLVERPELMQAGASRAACWRHDAKGVGAPVGRELADA